MSDQQGPGQPASAEDLSSRALSGIKARDCCRNAAAALAKGMKEEIEQLLKLYFEEWTEGGRTGRVGKAFAAPIIIEPGADRPRRGGEYFDPLSQAPLTGRTFGSGLGQLGLVQTAALAPAVIETVKGVVALTGMLVGAFSGTDLFTVREKPNASATAELVNNLIRNRVKTSRNLCEICVKESLWKQSSTARKLTKTARFRKP